MMKDAWKTHEKGHEKRPSLAFWAKISSCFTIFVSSSLLPKSFSCSAFFHLRSEAASFLEASLAASLALVFASRQLSRRSAAAARRAGSSRRARCSSAARQRPPRWRTISLKGLEIGEIDPYSS